MGADLLATLVWGSPTWGLAASLAVLSIMVAGLALGLGRAFAWRRLWIWGAEEMGQAIFNALLLGALIGLCAGAGALVGEMLPDGAGSACAGGLPPDTHAAMNLTLCQLENLSRVDAHISAKLLDQSYRMGMLASLSMSERNLSAQPHQALAWPAQTYAGWAQQIGEKQALIEANRRFLSGVAAAGFALFLPVGLLLRLFFLTRRLGSAIMAAAISFYLVYPLLLGALLMQSPSGEAGDALLAALEGGAKRLEGMDGRLDWDRSGSIRAMITGTDGAALEAGAAEVYAPMAAWQGTLLLHALIDPLVALVLTLVCAAALMGALGSEWKMDWAEMI